MAQRNEFGQFLPGESGNPSGKPKTKKVTDALRRLMELSPKQREKYEPLDGYEEAALMLIKSAFGGDGKFGQRTHALALIYDRIEGKADISDSEADAMKGQRTIVMDMPSPQPPAVVPTEEKQKPN